MPFLPPLRFPHYWGLGGIFLRKQNPQTPGRGVDAPLHGSLRNVQRLGGFAVGQALGFDEQKCVVQIRRQGGQGAGKARRSR